MPLEADGNPDWVNDKSVMTFFKSCYSESAPDGKYMWPFFKVMLERLEELVPNIDPAHRILGGFSNGAHATAALIDGLWDRRGVSACISPDNGNKGPRR